MMNQLVKIDDVKNGIINKFQTFLSTKGFKLKRTQLKFLRNNKSTITTISFKTYSYFPSHYEYSFSCGIYFKELDDLVNAYNSFEGKLFDVLCNLFINEGEFIYDLLTKEKKVQNFYTNELKTEEQLMIALDQTSKILENEVLPIIDANTSLLDFQKNFLIPEKILYRIDEPEFIISCLLASSLIDPEFCSEIGMFIKTEIKRKQDINGVEYRGMQRLQAGVSDFFLARGVDLKL